MERIVINDFGFLISEPNPKRKTNPTKWMISRPGWKEFADTRDDVISLAWMWTEENKEAK